MDVAAGDRDRHETSKKNYPLASRLGRAYDGLVLDGGEGLTSNLTLNMPRERFDDRWSLLSQLDGLKRRFDQTAELEGVAASEQQAVEVLMRGIADAFDLSKEDPKTVASYDTSHLARTSAGHRDADAVRSRSSSAGHRFAERISEDDQRQRTDSRTHGVGRPVISPDERPGKKLEIVAENELGEFCDASPAISDGEMFLRSENPFWCIGGRASTN